MAIARCEEERPDEHVIGTLYLTRGEFGEFFVATETTKKTKSDYPHSITSIEPMQPMEAHEWILRPDVKPLALLYPELTKAETQPVDKEIVAQILEVGAGAFGEDRSPLRGVMKHPGS
jgi:hypothetical protein